MTVPSVGLPVVIPGDGSNKSFTFNVEVASAAEVVCYLQDADGSETLISSDISVTLVNGGADGATVTYPVVAPALTASQKIAIRRITDKTQAVSLPNGGAYFSKTIEGIADKSARAIQDLQATLNLVPRVPLGESGFTLPTAAARAGKYQYFDQSGNPVYGTTVNLETVAGGILEIVAVGGDLLGDDNIGTVAANIGAITNLADFAAAGNPASLSLISRNGSTYAYQPAGSVGLQLLSSADAATAKGFLALSTGDISGLSGFVTGLADNIASALSNDAVSPAKVNFSIITNTDANAVAAAVTNWNLSALNEQILVRIGAEAGAIKTALDALPDTNLLTDDERTKLAGLESSRFKGTFVSLVALQTALPTGSPGDYADVDAGPGQFVGRYIWDNDDNDWVAQGGGTTLTGAQIKTLYEGQPNTNGYSDNDKGKVDNLPADTSASLAAKANAADLALVANYGAGTDITAPDVGGFNTLTISKGFHRIEHTGDIHQIDATALSIGQTAKLIVKTGFGPVNFIRNSGPDGKRIFPTDEEDVTSVSTLEFVEITRATSGNVVLQSHPKVTGFARTFLKSTAAALALTVLGAAAAEQTLASRAAAATADYDALPLGTKVRVNGVSYHTEASGTHDGIRTLDTAGAYVLVSDSTGPIDVVAEKVIEPVFSGLPAHSADYQAAVQAAEALGVGIAYYPPPGTYAYLGDIDHGNVPFYCAGYGQAEIIPVRTCKRVFEFSSGNTEVEGAYCNFDKGTFPRMAFCALDTHNKIDEFHFKDNSARRMPSLLIDRTVDYWELNHEYAVDTVFEDPDGGDLICYLSANSRLANGDTIIIYNLTGAGEVEGLRTTWTREGKRRGRLAGTSAITLTAHTQGTGRVKRDVSVGISNITKVDDSPLTVTTDTDLPYEWRTGTCPDFSGVSGSLGTEIDAFLASLPAASRRITITASNQFTLDGSDASTYNVGEAGEFSAYVASGSDRVDIDLGGSYLTSIDLDSFRVTGNKTILGTWYNIGLLRMSGSIEVIDNGFGTKGCAIDALGNYRFPFNITTTTAFNYAAVGGFAANEVLRLSCASTASMKVGERGRIHSAVGTGAEAAKVDGLNGQEVEVIKIDSATAFTVRVFTPHNIGNPAAADFATFPQIAFWETPDVWGAFVTGAGGMTWEFSGSVGPEDELYAVTPSINVAPVRGNTIGAMMDRIWIGGEILHENDTVTYDQAGEVVANAAVRGKFSQFEKWGIGAKVYSTVFIFSDLVCGAAHTRCGEFYGETIILEDFFAKGPKNYSNMQDVSNDQDNVIIDAENVHLERLKTYDSMRDGFVISATSKNVTLEFGDSGSVANDTDGTGRYAVNDLGSDGLEIIRFKSHFVNSNSAAHGNVPAIKIAAGTTNWAIEGTRIKANTALAAGVGRYFDLGNTNGRFIGNRGLDDGVKLDDFGQHPTDLSAASIVAVKDSGFLTIASDAITITGSRHDLLGEGGAADDLGTINGASRDGQLLYIRQRNNAQDITIKDGIGNIECGADIALTTVNGFVVLMWDANVSKWYLFGGGDL